MHSYPESGLADYLIPQWPAPAGVRAVCSTRAGGVSAPPYDSLNLGDHVGDDPYAVQSNRVRLQRTLKAKAVFLNQVHGTQVLELVPDTPDKIPADAAFTRHAGLVCSALVADCLPILLCDLRGSVVAAVHAGWRGLAGQDGKGILETVFETIRAPDLMECARGDAEFIAWLGPCIGPDAFEVGAEVVSAFTDGNPQASSCFKACGTDKWLANLPALARQRLQALGVVQLFGNDGSPAWCTFTNPTRFFSYRRDGHTTGRFAACIWLE